MIENKHLLKQSHFISFFYHDKILIVGKGNNRMIQFNEEADIIESDFELSQEDSFGYFHSGLKIKESVYLVGYYDIYEIIYNEIKIIKHRGYDFAYSKEKV